MKVFGKGMIAAATAVGAVMFTASAASATILNLNYDAQGTSHLASTNSDVEIAPTTLSLAAESADGSFTAHLPIHDTSSTFAVLGLLPVSATVSFVEAAPVTGNLITEGTTVRVESTASYYIKLSNVKVAGLPAFVGDYCQTADPVIIPANTPAGQTFSILRGGELSGEFSIGNFEHCGLDTLLINQLIPGSGNTANLTVSNGRLG